MGFITDFEGLGLGVLRHKFMGIMLYQYCMALFFIFGGFVLRKVLDKVLDRLLEATKHTRIMYDDILVDTLRRPLPWACLILGIYLALRSLPIPTEPLDISRFVDAMFRSLSVIFALWVTIRLVDRICHEWARSVKEDDADFDGQLIPIIRKTLRVFLMIVGGILLLQNLGYSVGSLIAGFGLGGAAVALAAKDSLGNLFGSIIIFLDRPFRIGDWIEMDGCEGTVEEIGLRTTRVRTFANSLMTVPNGKFTNVVINNWSKMKKRRIKFHVTVTYRTKAKELEALVLAIRKVIKDDPDLRDDFSLVNFDTFGAFSLDILIYCFTKTTSWKEWLGVKQNFMFNVMHEVEKLGLEFAFPTQTLHMARPPLEESLPK